MSWVFFTSYARANAKHSADADNMNRFVADLNAAVGQSLDPPVDGPGFLDKADIEAGEEWGPGLEDALSASPACLALYSPSYFSSDWCGREFQVFLDRAAARPGNRGGVPRGIVPVLWIKCQLPKCASPIQYSDESFPPEYEEYGLRQLMRLTRYRDEYELVVQALAKRVIKAATAANLPIAARLNLDTVVSAWQRETDSDPHSHTTGSISKACFVFVARDGWHWMPYAGASEKIGAMAQQVSGQLGLEYEAIPCDRNTIAKLVEANGKNVPALVLADPASLTDPVYAAVMRDYDTRYLLNCGVIVAWSGEAESVPAWEHLRKRLCPQKVSNPPPHHEWRSVFSPIDLKAKTQATIDQIKMRLMNALIEAMEISAGAAPQL